MYNAMAAILAALKAGVSDEDLRKGLTTFPQVEHRLETVDVVNGVTYINDSKATNVDSACMLWIVCTLRWCGLREERIKEMITACCLIW